MGKGNKKQEHLKPSLTETRYFPHRYYQMAGKQQHWDRLTRHLWWVQLHRHCLHACSGTTTGVVIADPTSAVRSLKLS